MTSEVEPIDPGFMKALKSIFDKNINIKILKEKQKKGIFAWIGYILMFIVYFIIEVVKFLLSIFALLLLLLLVYLIYIFIYKGHPRLFFIARWSPFHSYMSSYIDDMMVHFKSLKSLIDKQASPIQSKCYQLTNNNLITAIGKIAPQIDELATMSKDDIILLFKFWDSLKSPTGFLSKIDLGDIDDSSYLTNDEVDVNNPKFKKLVESAEKLRTLASDLKSLKSTLNDNEFAKKESEIIGCMDPLKLKWIQLILKNEVNTDSTLLALSQTLANVSGTDSWAIHLKTDVCAARPLTPNERIYLEIKDYCNKCQDKTTVLEYIALVLADEGAALKETRQIFNGIMSVYELDLMLNYYLYDIKLGYETRKSGFKLNFVVLRYFLWPYIQWTFVVKIYTQIWGTFGTRFVQKLKTEFGSTIEWWNTIPAMLTKLPQSFAGGEGFESHTDPKYKYFALVDKIFGKKDTVEHFGFLKGLISIGEFFKGILDAVTSLMFAITNPIKFLMMLIGFVMSIILIIAYSILTVFFVQYILGAVWTLIVVIIPAIFMTTLYAVLIVPIGAWFIIVWLLDLITGGLMMALYRCENNPDKWYKYPAYANGNSYQRVLFCTYRCAENYEPWSFLGILNFCSRIPKMKPAYCPQQNIFKLYKGETLKSPSHYKDFEVNLETANMTTSQREAYLTKIKYARVEFSETCKYCFENDALFGGLLVKMVSYNHISKFLCKYTAQLAGNNPLKYKQVCDVCTNMYGGDVPMYKGEGNTFNTTSYATNDDSSIIDIPNLPPSNEISKSIYMLIACIIFVTLIAYLITIFNKLDKTTNS